VLLACEAIYRMPNFATDQDLELAFMVRYGNLVHNDTGTMAAGFSTGIEATPFLDHINRKRHFLGCFV
jgi:hypothetical protein